MVKGGRKSLKPKKLGLSHDVTNFKSNDFYSSVNSNTISQNCLMVYLFPP
jgi:hypothetical protein